MSSTTCPTRKAACPRRSGARSRNGRAEQTERPLITDRPPDDEAPVLPWDLFATRIFRWGQDQHVGIIGPTEQGKSNLAYHLLQRRSYVAYMGIKSRDKTLDSFARSGGYQRIYDWPPKQGHIRKRPVPWEDMPRRLVWPDATNRRGSRETQRQVFTRM